jgi:hypothetical protein
VKQYKLLYHDYQFHHHHHHHHHPSRVKP